MKYGSRIFCTVLAIAMFSKLHAQVNLTTGAAEYNIPLYSYSNTNNRLSTSISLEYISGNGLKANDIPSAIGAGWNLQAGGVIERIQHGLPDDQKRYAAVTYADMNQINYFPNADYVDNYYPNGFLYSEYDPANLVNNGGGYTPLFEYPVTKFAQMPEYTADYEQDVFAFTFNGQAGFFVISKPDVNGVSEIRTLVDSKLRIKVIHGDLNNTNNIRTTISEFWITDETGIKYIFRDAELIQECQYDSTATYNPDGTPYTGSPWQWYYPGTTPPSSPNLRVVRGAVRNAFIKSKWYLSEIVNSLTGKKIVFEYESYQMDMQGALVGQAETIDGNEEFWVTQERMVGTWKRLRRIKLSPVETVEFNYAATPREDVPMDRALDNIDIQCYGQSRFKWEFTTGYFVKNIIQPPTHSFTAADKAWARLCLQKLQRKGFDGTTEPPYEFNYWLQQETSLLTNVVPPLFTFYQDFWGYFNPKNMGWYDPLAGTFGSTIPYTAVSGNVMPKLLYYNYTPFPQGVSINRRGPSLESRNGILKSVRNPLGGKLEYEYEQNHVYIVGSHYYGMGGVRVKQTSMNNGLDADTINIKEYKYVKEDGVTSSSWGGNDDMVYHTTSSAKIYRKCGGQEYPGIAIAKTAILFQSTLNWSGSVGIAALKSLSFVAGIILQGILANYLSDIMGPQSTTFPSLSRSSLMYNGHNLIPLQYGRVEVTEKLGATNIGKTVFEFTSPNETNPLFAIDFPALSVPFSSKQRFAFWLYGLPKKSIVYDNAGNMIAKTENEYNAVKYFLTDNRHLSQKWSPNKRTYDCSEFPNNVPGINEIDHDTSRPICGRVERISEKQYVYNSNHDSTVITTLFSYSPLNYKLNKVSTTNSRGELVETRTHYPLDYANFETQKMKDSNMISIPVSSETIITKSGGQQFLLKGDVTAYLQMPGGDIKELRSYATQGVDPIPYSLVAFTGTSSWPTMSNYYKETSNTFAKAEGWEQMNTQTGLGVRRITNILDYNNKFITSTTVNGSSADITYTSFEAEFKGDWTYDQAKVVEDWSPTGKRCLKATQLDGTTISRAIKNTRVYTLSFWVKGEMPIMSGGTFTLKSTYVNAATGWTYYEYAVTNGTSITITNINGTFPYVNKTFCLDEIRCHYAESRMKTSTYDPVFGKTSECDENGRITYYEYDGLGRIKLIRDDNRNVIKTYEYNYKQ